MKRLVCGILAHVDSGKTTLSEAMLFSSGQTRKIGRVDHGDSFLDTNEIERDRGITIFSKQAIIGLEDAEITLVDTPGHVDFSAEAERTLRVLDYAILVISGTDGVQSHTETLWSLLRHYDIPTFIFVNKMDLQGTDEEELMKALTQRLDQGCVDFSRRDEAFFENVSMCSEELLEEYLNTGRVEKTSLQEAVASRKLFPCFFGSALKVEGVSEFLEGLKELTKEKSFGDKFGAKVFKISEDDKGQRLTFMKITGGSLKVKSVLESSDWSAKVNDLRVYSGDKYKSEQEVFAGSICAVPGNLKARPGDGLGVEPDSESLVLEPVFTYSVVLPKDTDMTSALSVFRRLEEEETQMHVLFNEHLQRIDVQVMGEVQLEVLKRILEERFALKAEFTHGSIIYKETILDTVEGVGHYEPLRHYAEVHLLMEKGKRGSGLVFASRCSEDVLDRNWQRLIMTHLAEKTHRGVLCGAPLTDVKITLINGKAHIKHTDGGDFRQATYRAVRQGLMQAQNVLLEPYYTFNLQVPTWATGRAMTDLQRMEAQFSAPEVMGEMSVIKGEAPVSKIRDYHGEVVAYTKGQGRLNCLLKGYEPCKEQDSIVKEIGYDCEADTENTPHSVFCAHGSGFTVKWNEVFQYMHIPALNLNQAEEEAVPHIAREKWNATDEELMRIFENTYGEVKHRLPKPPQVIKSPNPTVYKEKPKPAGPEYLLIDGYNIIFAWDELKELARESLEGARDVLLHRIANYRAIRQNNIILVFDAYKVKGGMREIERQMGVTVVYTKEAETADSYIEKTSKELSKNYRVKVATSDSLEQMIIFGNGATRLSASNFKAEVESAEAEMRELVERNNLYEN